MYYQFSSVRDQIDAMIPGVCKTAGLCGCLIVAVKEREFNRVNFNFLQQCFLPLMPAIAVSCSLSEKFKIKSAFDEYLLLKQQIEVWSGGSIKASGSQLEYCVGEWSGSESGVPFVSRSKSRFLRSEIMFLPQRQDVTVEWPKAITGLAWLHLCDRWVANSPEPAFDAEAIVRSIVLVTASFGGVVGLKWTDSNDERGLAFFGTNEVLASARNRMQNSSLSQEQDMLKGMTSSGYSFDLIR